MSTRRLASALRARRRWTHRSTRAPDNRATHRTASITSSASGASVNGERHSSGSPNVTLPSAQAATMASASSAPKYCQTSRVRPVRSNQNARTTMTIGSPAITRFAISGGGVAP